MNTNHRTITPIFNYIFQQFILILLLTTCMTGVLAGCANNPLQNQSESEENSSEQKSVNEEKQNQDEDEDEEDEQKKNSQRKDEDND